MSGEATIRACTISMAFAMAALAVSNEPVLTAAALVLAGAVWMAAIALFNIGVQLSAPRWVAGRSLAAFQASISGGIAIGAWGWGRLTDYAGVEIALLTAAGLMLISPILGLWLTMPRVGARNEDADVLADPEVKLSLTGRSGPLVVEIEYRVAQENARAFHNVMQDVQLSRQRNGAYGWSIARDIADPELWTERYHCPTWFDYLRQRNRSTQSERALHQHLVRQVLGTLEDMREAVDRRADESRVRGEQLAILGLVGEAVALGDRAHRRRDERMLDRIFDELAAHEQAHVASFEAVQILVDGLHERSPSQVEKAAACAASARLEVSTPTWPASSRKMRAPGNASADSGGVMVSELPETTSVGSGIP